MYFPGFFLLRGNPNEVILEAVGEDPMKVYAPDKKSFKMHFSLRLFHPSGLRFGISPFCRTCFEGKLLIIQYIMFPIVHLDIYMIELEANALTCSTPYMFLVLES